ncbi:hypothetical protein L6452_03497 [Arctium lappa]|uniref:Uncharacterized protein n=1 Tax=Arctium lappa TaxID=4217 RepID=A0ACB9FND8_ARCLA|nr:hypothetical protein L6452_03497 [Arctium lappa]
MIFLPLNCFASKMYVFVASNMCVCFAGEGKGMGWCMKKSKLFLVQMKKLNLFLVESSDGKDEIEQRWWSNSAVDNGGSTMESYGVWKERWGRYDLMRRLC